MDFTPAPSSASSPSRTSRASGAPRSIESRPTAALPAATSETPPGGRLPRERPPVPRRDRTAAGAPGIQGPSPAAPAAGHQARDDRSSPPSVSGPASPLHLAQHHLLGSLAAAASRSGLVRLVADCRLDALEQDGQGVSAHTTGSSTAWWRGSFLVGCDGPRSTVRKLLQVGFPGRTTVDRYAVAVLRAELPFSGEALLHWDPPWPGESEVTARPLPHGCWRLDWRLPPLPRQATPADPALTSDALVARIRSTLTGWCGTVPEYDLLASAEYRVHQRLAKRWRVGRVFLAGDAAHQLGALGVQSVAEGLHDADNLAWKIAVAWHHRASRALLDSYQQERRAAVGARLRAVDQALPQLRSSGALRSVRRSLLTGPTRRHAALLADAQVGTGVLGAPAEYRRSVLSPSVLGPVTKSSAAAPSGACATPVGGQVEDVPVISMDGGRTRLRSELGRGLLVVLVAPGTAVWESRHWLSAGLMPALTEATEALPVAAELLVTESYPGSPPHTVLLVRPDGHLGAVMHGCRPAELLAYTELLLDDEGGTADAEPSLPTSA